MLKKRVKAIPIILFGSPVPAWAKRAVDEWTGAAAINGGAIFRRVSRLDKIWGDRITPKHWLITISI